MKPIYLLVFLLVIPSSTAMLKPICSSCGLWIERDSFSMNPTLNYTSKLYVEEISKNNIKALKIGDIIGYIPPKEYKEMISGSYIVHRIIARKRGGWVTKGDNNTRDDFYPVKDEQVRYKVVKIKNANT